MTIQKEKSISGSSEGEHINNTECVDEDEYLRCLNPHRSTAATRETAPVGGRTQDIASSRASHMVDEASSGVRSPATKDQALASNAYRSGLTIMNAPFTVVTITPGVLTLVATNNQNNTVTITATGHHTGRTATSTIASQHHLSRQTKQNEPKLREGKETFASHPLDRTKLIARFRVQNPYNPDGEWLEQIDEIPVLNQNIELSKGDDVCYFEPDPEKAKVPPKARANKQNLGLPATWSLQSDGSWTRPRGENEPDDVWRPTLIFRRYLNTNNSYEEGYMSLARLKDIDPNNKDWYYAYNKWIDQFRRRRDSNYKKVMNKDHWTVAERCALIQAINEFVHKYGIHNFGTGKEVSMGPQDYRKITDAVNAVGQKSRRADAIRGQIYSSHQHKNKVIDDLIKRANQIRSQLANKEAFTKSELFPREAIPRVLWPTEDGQSSGRARKTLDGRRKGTFDDFVATFPDGKSFEPDRDTHDDTDCATISSQCQTKSKSEAESRKPLNEKPSTASKSKKISKVKTVKTSRSKKRKLSTSSEESQVTKKQKCSLVHEVADMPPQIANFDGTHEIATQRKEETTARNENDRLRTNEQGFHPHLSSGAPPVGESNEGEDTDTEMQDVEGDEQADHES